jgi:2,4-dienoyl-CoA reductase-like NADH-dependent reductase (Old Yellow Enzyme family)
MTNSNGTASDGVDTGVGALFEPVRIAGLEVRNRLVMAPMTRSHSPNGIPGQNVVDYYRRRAEGGVGLIITEGAWIPHPMASNELNVPRLFGDESMAGWREVVNSVHTAGAKIFAQLWHVGLTMKPQIEAVFGEDDFSREPTMGPSGIRFAGGDQEFEPMSRSDIDLAIAAYGEAAASSKEMGFDGIEIHGAHGYLIDQFLWEATNKRTDEYGGSIANRARFATEVVAAARRRVGPDFPIGLRISQWKTIDFTARNAQSADELQALLAPIAAAGVDIFHCSTRRYWEPEFEGSNLNLAGWVKKLTGKPTITVGSVGLGTELMESLGGAETVQSTGIGNLLERLGRDEFDMVAVGRALIADPEWPSKIKSGRDDFALFSSPLLLTLS